MGQVLCRVAQRAAITAYGHMVSEWNRDQKAGGWLDSRFYTRIQLLPDPGHLLSARRFANLFKGTLSFKN